MTLFYFPEGNSPDESLLSILRSANKTGRFWVGASDFEERGKFKWYYSGKPVSESNWFENGGRPKAPATKEDDDRCLQVRFFTDYPGNGNKSGYEFPGI